VVLVAVDARGVARNLQRGVGRGGGTNQGVWGGRSPQWGPVAGTAPEQSRGFSRKEKTHMLITTAIKC